MTSRHSFETFINEFKGNREGVINILKIVLEQRKVEEFKKFLVDKDEENHNAMRDFIKSKYYEFVESIQNINECNIIVKMTEDAIGILDENIQIFLENFSNNYVEKLRNQEILKNIGEEKERLNNALIFFAYINKAELSLKDQQFQLTIRLINIAQDKHLKKFQINSSVHKKGLDMIMNIKNKITAIIEKKLEFWMSDISKEQITIGQTLFRRFKAELEKAQKSELDGSINILEKSNIRSTKNIVDNLLLIRNTSNLNYMMNRNSLLKQSVLSQADILEEFDIINMVSNVDINFLEQSYSIYKKVDMDTKFIDKFRNYRYSQIHTLLEIQRDKEYEIFFSEILGFIIIQVSVYEILPIFFTKRKFEEFINFLFKELQITIDREFDNLKTYKEYIVFEKALFVFLKCIERIGISEKVGIDIKSGLLDIMRDKVSYLNYVLINKYNNIFTNMLYDEKCQNIEVKNMDDYMKYVNQYSITLDENSKPQTIMIYPYFLPYTMFVVDVNEHFKRYFDEIFEYIKPIFTEYDLIIQNVTRDFLKKLNESFLLFSNSIDQDLSVILLAQICNNIRFILKSYGFYESYIMKKANLKTKINFESEKSLKEVWQNYEEQIYENLKNRFRHLMSDLNSENWMPDKPSNHPSEYIENMVLYLQTIYFQLQNNYWMYIETCFRDAINHLPKLFFEILLNSNVVKTYNIYAIENLKRDIDHLDNYFKPLSNVHLGLGDCLVPIKSLLNIFIIKKFDIYLDKSRYVDNFFDIKSDDLIKFLSKYKNLKKSSEMKGKISESDITNFIKKLKELK